MAITDDNSVLILGAGASVLFEMPLGGQLMEAIRLQIDSERRKLQEVASRNFDRTFGSYLRNAVQRNEGIFSVPIHAAVYLKYSDGHRNEEVSNQNKNLEEMLILLSNQTSETIDDFIVENPSYAELTKICIASVFFKTLYKKAANSIVLKSLDHRSFQKRKRVGEVGSVFTTDDERNWIHLLINIVRQGIRSGVVSETQKIKIITFNYDVILEKVLEKQFANSEMMNGKNWVDFFEIIHPHGKCNPLPNLTDNAAELIVEWANGIYVIQEHAQNVPKNILNDRELAKNIVKQSHEVYAAGFSFAAPNCRMLGLQEPWNNIKMSNVDGGFNRHFRFCNYDGNYGISRSVKAFESNKNSRGTSWTINVVDEQAGTTEKPLSIANWIRMGVLGELPG